MTSEALIVIKGSGGGGLGDRIRAALVGFLYAELTGRAVFVDWRDGVYGPEGLNVFDLLFRIRSLPVLDEIPTSATTKPIAWAGRLASSMDQVWREDGNNRWDRADAIARYSFDLGELSHPERVLVMWEFDQLDALRPHLAAEQRKLDAEVLLTSAYRRFLSPSMALDREVADCFEGVDGPTIGVHVRATRESREQRGSVPMSAYFRALDRLLGAGDVGRVFVCTDNWKAERELIERYPIAWSRRKWFAHPGESLHLNDACPDKLQAAKDAIVEMLLLARCDWLISVQGSSFSMLSRIMSSAPMSHRIQLSPPVSLKSMRRRFRYLFGC